MFNTFFKGSVDDLLKKVTEASTETIDAALDPDRLLNHKELVDTVIDEFKLPPDEAERIVTEIQMSELDTILRGMLEKGLVEVVSYDTDGNPEYKPTELGLKLLK